MMKSTTVLLLLAAVIAMVATTTMARRIYTPDDHMEFLASKNPQLAAHDNTQDYPAKWFTQSLDHFDPLNVATWQQRYFESDDFVTDGKPDQVFLYIGCEGPVSAKYFTQGLLFEYAKQYKEQYGLKTKILILEHRYYGESQPVAKWDIEGLKYLTTNQALEDLATFVASFNLANVPWISFGGSYGGSLSSYSRIKYPTLIAGAISASGPMDPVYDFQGYLYVAERALEYYGGKTCVANMQTANSYISDMLNSKQIEAYNKLSSDLKLCNAIPQNLETLDRQSFWQSLTDSFASVVQYNHENGVAWNIKAVCDVMAQGTTPNDKYNNIVKVHNTVLSSQGEECRNWDFKWNVAEISNQKPGAGNAMRAWIWQSITNYGYFQSNSGMTSAFGELYPVTFFEKMNQAGYGQEWDMKRSMLLADRFNASFGSIDQRSQGIIYTNGNIDPWSYLSVYRHNPEQLVFSHYINGTAHCAPLYASTPDDVPGLTQARKEMYVQLKAIIDNFPKTIKSTPAPQSEFLQLAQKLANPSPMRRRAGIKKF